MRDSGFLFAVIGMLLSPVTAQRDKFGEIECTRLTVVDADGKTRVNLTTDEYGGVVSAFGKDGKLAAWLCVNEHGGRVAAYGKDGKSRAALGVIEHWGFVQVKGKGEAMAVMSINEYGNGAVFTYDKNGNPLK